MISVMSKSIRQEQFSPQSNYSVGELKIKGGSQTKYEVIKRSNLLRFIDALWEFEENLLEVQTSRIQLARLIAYSSITENPKKFPFAIDIGFFYLFDEHISNLSNYLIPLGFTRSETYTDPYDGKVVDFFFKQERITCIVSEEDIQILSYVRGSFSEKVFALTSQSKFDISEYMQNLCKNLEV